MKWLLTDSFRSVAANYDAVGYYPDPRIIDNTSVPLSLLFLSNRASFLGVPVEDPWFRATDLSYTQFGTMNASVPLYQSSVPGAVLGCTEQMQLW